MYRRKYSSPLGDMIMKSDKGDKLSQLHFSSPQDKFEDSDDLDFFKKIEKWLDNYFDGKNPKINFKLNPQGSDFQLRVWKLLSEIPYGKTSTYGEIAQKISPTMAAQAVGGAVGRNPIAIIIPCHRVVGANGKMIGYAAGIDKKIRLLNIEKRR